MAGTNDYEMNRPHKHGGIQNAMTLEAVLLKLEAEERRARIEKEHLLRKRDPWHHDCMMFNDNDIPNLYDNWD